MLKDSTDNSTAGGGGTRIAGAVVATVNSNSAGSVNTTGVRAQLSRTAGGAFSDRVLVPMPSRYAFNTGSRTIVATVRGAQIAGGAGAVIAAGAATINSNSAGAVNTTAAAGAFYDHMLMPMASLFFFKTVAMRQSRCPHRRGRHGRQSCGRRHAGTNGAGTVNTTDLLAQLSRSRTAGDAFSDQMLNPSASGFHITAGTVSNIVINSDAQIANGSGAVIAAGAAAVHSQNAGAVNTYNGIVVSQPTRRKICFVLGVAVGLSKIDAISFVLGVA